MATKPRPTRAVAAAKPTAAEASAYVADAVYGVRLKRSAEWAGRTLVPGRDLTLKGKVCNAIAPAILTAEEIRGGEAG